MTQTHSGIDTHGKNAQKETSKIKLREQIEDLTANLELLTERCTGNTLNFMGYAVAGIALWFLMHWKFELVFPNNADVPGELLRFKDIWNAAMYIVPYCFWGVATKYSTIVVITILNICLSAFKLSRLKKEIGHNAQ